MLVVGHGELHCSFWKAQVLNVYQNGFCSFPCAGPIKLAIAMCPAQEGHSAFWSQWQCLAAIQGQVGSHRIWAYGRKFVESSGHLTCIYSGME